MKALRIFAVLALLGPLGPAQAADFSDPTWPCVQRKVERMSMGLMWPIMPDENAVPDAAAQADITKLAELLALRRIEVAELEDEVAGFATTYKGDPQILTRVFAEVFDTLSQRRSRIIKGIADFSLSQIELSEKIDSDRGEMDRLLAAGAQIPVERTEPALDLDLLLGGLKPVLRSLNPADAHSLLAQNTHDTLTQP